jgi:hypothetical protein
MSAGLEIVEPAPRRTASRRHALVERPSSPDGLVVGFREFWPKFDVFTRALEGILKGRFAVRGVQRIDGTRPRSGGPLQAWNQFHKNIDWAVLGLGG